MADGQQGQALAVRGQGQALDARSDKMAFEPGSFEELRGVATALARSGLMPRGLDTPEKITVAVMTGRELGLSTMQAVRSIHVIEGKPALSSALIVALCKRQRDVCVYFRLVESTDEIATYETHRVGEPEPTRLSFTIAQARAAGVTSKDNWRKYPAAMLRARCETALARAVYPDLAGGLYDYDSGELESTPAPPRDVTPRPVTVTVEQPTAPPATTKANDEPVDEPAADEATGEVPISFAARSILEKIAAATSQKDLNALGAEIKSAIASGDLTVDERASVIVPAYAARKVEVRS